MKSSIFFAPLTHDTPFQEADKKLKVLFDKAGLNTCIQSQDLVAVKLHFGDPGNKNTIPPHFVRSIVDAIKQQQAMPFLTDTCVLYKSPRSDAANHLIVAQNQGYTLEATGAPIIIADGINGSNEIEVPIPGRLFQKVSIAADAVMANAMIVLSHVTGHIGTGLGATLKNLGMGLASRKGKLRQHSGIKPRIIAARCTGCELCARWCPQNAIQLQKKIAVIQYDRCIGCGQCMAVCRFRAVSHDWAVHPNELQQRVAEHALGAIMNKREKVGYLNFVTRVTKDCDCMGHTQPALIPDIGVLAGRDPVAIDAAALALIQNHTRQQLSDLTHTTINYQVQLDHGAAIGLGSTDFEIIQVPN